MFTCYCGTIYYHIRLFPELQSIALSDEIWVYFNKLHENDPGSFDLRCGLNCANCDAALPVGE